MLRKIHLKTRRQIYVGQVRPPPGSNANARRETSFALRPPTNHHDSWNYTRAFSTESKNEIRKKHK